jgi:muramoyltetrapeptide carboxypeptidase
MLIRPRHLAPGDMLGIVSPASAPPDPASIDRGVAALEKLGYPVKLAPNVRKRFGFLAGTDQQRADDLMNMFTDPEVRAILCVRGGYGTPRLLPLLDYQVIRKHPKIFVGYSDITALHCAFLTQARLISFHGPMLNSDFAHPEMPDFTMQSFRRTLALIASPQTKLPFDTSLGHRKDAVKILRRGMARGQLIGGNLSLLCSLVGTRWQPNFKGRILFLEDVGEPPYRFDRMLTQLLNAGLLQQVAGIAIGVNADCEDPKSKTTNEYRQTLEDVLKDRLLGLKVPIVTGLAFGHVPHNATLPVGARAILNANRGVLSLAESPVK